MAIKHARVTVGTTATLLDTFDMLDGSGTVSIQNLGTVSVYIGGPGVTTTSYGYELKANSSLSIDMKIPETVYGVVATGTATVNVLTKGA